MKKILWSVVLLLSFAVFAACGSDDGDTSFVDGDMDQEDVEGLESEDDLESDADGDGEDDGGESLEEMEEEAGPIDPSISPDDLVLDAQEVFNPELPEGVRVKVGTYNIYGTHYATEAELGAFFKTLDLDVISLQEIDVAHAQPIAEAAGYEHFEAAAGKAIMSKTPLTDFAEIDLQSGRSILHAFTQIQGVTFSIYAAHISWNVDGDLQCRNFIDNVLVNDDTPHLLMMGDFNDETHSTQINILNEALNDTATVLGWFPGEHISWPSTRFDESEGSQLIDLIFFRKSFQPIVIKEDVLNLAPVLSDHKPVVAELLFPKGDQAFDNDPYAKNRDIWKDFPAEGDLPENLLLNPGAEDGMNSWEASNGATVTDERENQQPRNGASFFTGFEKYESGSHVSAASQVIDLSEHVQEIDQGLGRLLASAYITTGYKAVEGEGIVANSPLPYDEGEVVVEAIDSEGNSIAQLYSKRRDTLDWHPFAGMLNLPVGTRKASYSWISHHKAKNGKGNDACFDDLYLAYQSLPEAHERLGGNLLANPGAEAGEATGFEADGWSVEVDSKIMGFFPYPPLAFSGDFFFYGGGENLVSDGKPGMSTLAQKIDLADYRDEMNAGTLALRWGGWMRSYITEAEVAVDLEIYDYDGSLWGTVSGDKIPYAEWTKLEYLTLIPKGASAVRLVLSADVEAGGTGVFADGLFVVPERI